MNIENMIKQLNQETIHEHLTEAFSLLKEKAAELKENIICFPHKKEVILQDLPELTNQYQKLKELNQLISSHKYTVQTSRSGSQFFIEISNFVSDGMVTDLNKIENLLGETFSNMGGVISEWSLYLSNSGPVVEVVTQVTRDLSPLDAEVTILSGFPSIS